MKRRDYMVTSDQTDEEIFDTLTEARARCKELSLEYGWAKINRWNYVYEDFEFDEEFEIEYKDGKDITKKLIKFRL